MRCLCFVLLATGCFAERERDDADPPIKLRAAALHITNGRVHAKEQADYGEMMYFVSVEAFPRAECLDIVGRPHGSWNGVPLELVASECTLRFSIPASRIPSGSDHVINVHDLESGIAGTYTDIGIPTVVGDTGARWSLEAGTTTTFRVPSLTEAPSLCFFRTEPPAMPWPECVRGVASEDTSVTFALPAELPVTGTGEALLVLGRTGFRRTPKCSAGFDRCSSDVEHTIIHEAVAR